MSTTDNGTTNNGKTKAATTVPVEETAERLARPLIKLAKACGVATFYIDQLGDYTEITDEALVGVLDALGYPATTSESIENSLKRVQEKRDSELLPPTVVCFTGTETIVPIHAEEATSSPEKIHITLTLEDGSEYEEPLNNFETSEEDGLTLELPQDLPTVSYTHLRAHET